MHAGIALLAACALLAGVLSAATAGSYHQQTLYNFRAQPCCIDGEGSNTPLLTDGAGNLYGTTSVGGSFTGGAIFELTPNAAHTAWTETVLYDFCLGTDCSTGNNASGALIMDGAGNLYGTAASGGAHGGGVVFELIPNQARTAWTYTVLYNFCAQTAQGVCADGAYPSAGVIADAAGNLYGVTDEGGAGNPGGCVSSSNVPQGCGVIFELTPNAAHTAWTETILHSFCSQPGCVDGASASGVIFDGAGNLYGTTFFGGGNGSDGVVYELAPNQSHTTWTETILYNFCSQSECVDGARPAAGVVMDEAGNLYGTTPFAGLQGRGTVYQLTPNATHTAWTYTVLHSFCPQGDPCTDGQAPQGPLVLDGAGNLFGTTTEGGSSDPSGTSAGGTVFNLTPNQAPTAWTYTVLYSFCTQVEVFSGVSVCVDGNLPQGGVIMDGSGNLYGTTEGGGPTGLGTVFELIAPASPLVAAILPASRSVGVGGTATAFATIINAGTNDAAGCAIAPILALPATFLYQTTNPATNGLTGAANTPVGIAAGASQSFVIALTAGGAFNSTNASFSFSCIGLTPAPSDVGLNTLLLSASATPVPDVVALAATAQNDGIVHVTGSPSEGAFAVAAVNLGAGTQITASANTGSVTLPVSVNLCQTNPTTGQCTSAIGATVATTIAADATPTFAIFVSASGAVPFDPAHSRIFVQFADSGGTVRGETSVAVETE